MGLTLRYKGCGWCGGNDESCETCNETQMEYARKDRLLTIDLMKSNKIRPIVIFFINEGDDRSQLISNTTWYLTQYNCKSLAVDLDKFDISELSIDQIIKSIEMDKLIKYEYIIIDYPIDKDDCFFKPSILNCDYFFIKLPEEELKQGKLDVIYEKIYKSKEYWGKDILNPYFSGFLFSNFYEQTFDNTECFEFYKKLTSINIGCDFYSRYGYPVCESDNYRRLANHIIKNYRYHKSYHK